MQTHCSVWRYSPAQCRSLDSFWHCTIHCGAAPSIESLCSCTVIFASFPSNPWHCPTFGPSTKPEDWKDWGRSCNNVNGSGNIREAYFSDRFCFLLDTLLLLIRPFLLFCSLISPFGPLSICLIPVNFHLFTVYKERERAYYCRFSAPNQLIYLLLLTAAEMFHLRIVSMLAQQVGQEPTAHHSWCFKIRKNLQLSFLPLVLWKEVAIPSAVRKTQAFRFVLPGALEMGKWGTLRPALSFLHAPGLGAIAKWPLGAIWDAAAQAAA